jgi:hypothetical protein
VQIRCLDESLRGGSYHLFLDFLVVGAVGSFAASGSAVWYLTCFRAKLDLMLPTPGHPWKEIPDEALESGDDPVLGTRSRVVGVSRHEIALHDLRPLAHRALERVQRRLDLLFSVTCTSTLTAEARAFSNRAT